MRWLVCGSRYLGDLDQYDRTNELWPEKLRQYRFIEECLEKLATQYSKHALGDNWLPLDIEVIAGGAKGVDSVAIDWAMINWMRFKEYTADWERYGNAAGPIRNQQMLDEGKPDLVIAFPITGSRGTYDMIRRAEKAGTPVIQFHYKQERDKQNEQTREESNKGTKGSCDYS